jgi:hypothetical protein
MTQTALVSCPGMDVRRLSGHPVAMQALKLHLTVDDAVVRVLPALSALLGQHIELIALGEERQPSRRAPVPGALAGKIALKEDFDAPLPDDIRRSFEGDGP